MTRCDWLAAILCGGLIALLAPLSAVAAPEPAVRTSIEVGDHRDERVAEAATDRSGDEAATRAAERRGDADQPSAVPTGKPEKVAESVRAERGITYIVRESSSGPIEIKLDLVGPAAWRPAGLNSGGGDGASELPRSRRPCVVLIHGGGWSGGKREDMKGFAEFFAKRGMVAACVSYRLAPDHRAPAQVHDCAQAVRFLRANAASWGIDPDRIGAMGFSAGGHLAMMLAVGDDALSLGTQVPVGDEKAVCSGKVKAAVSVVGPAMLDGEDVPAISKSIVDGLVGEDANGRAERCREASPITFITKDDAPILMFQGSADPLVPMSQATQMATAMAKAGVPGRVELLIGAGHGWGGAEMKRTMEASAEFFERVFASSRK